MKGKVAALVFCLTTLMGVGSAFAASSTPSYVEWPDWFEGVHAPVTAASTTTSPNYVEWPDWFEGVHAPVTALSTTSSSPHYVEWPDWFE
jgi:hypothetical protein